MVALAKELASFEPATSGVIGVLGGFAYEAQSPWTSRANPLPPSHSRSACGSRLFVFGTYLDEVLMMRNAAGTKYYYHANHLYSVHAITNQSGAIVEAVGSYDAYGKSTILTGAGTDATWFTGDDVVGSVSAIGNPWFYTGQRLEAETGLFYYKNRYYSAELGRFVGRDPIGYKVGVNLYTYANGSSCKYIDPFGLTHCGVWICRERAVVGQHQWVHIGQDPCQTGWTAGFGDQTFDGQPAGWQPYSTGGGVAIPDPKGNSKLDRECYHLKINMTCALGAWGTNWTCNDVQNCIKTVVRADDAAPPDYGLVTNNCRHVSNKWVKDCCLEFDTSIEVKKCYKGPKVGPVAVGIGLGIAIGTSSGMGSGAIAGPGGIALGGSSGGTAGGSFGGSSGATVGSSDALAGGKTE